jgi:hypothetical protein
MSETGTPADAVPEQRQPDEVEAAVPEAGEAQEEWPPREWRETTRSAGHRQALYVSLGMVVIFVVLVLVNTWGSHQG